jgi:RHS repeat-associated protein
VFDGNGTVLGRQDFTPFGTPVVPPSAMPKEGFGGNEHDDETDLSYFHARMFQARAGRFTRPDPIVDGIFDPQLWNRYTYVRNIPTRLIDTDGLSPKTGKDGQGFDCGAILAQSPNDFWCNPPSVFLVVLLPLSLSNAPPAAALAAWVEINTVARLAAPAQEMVRTLVTAATIVGLLTQEIRTTPPMD